MIAEVNANIVGIFIMSFLLAFMAIAGIIKVSTETVKMSNILLFILPTSALILQIVVISICFCLFSMDIAVEIGALTSTISVGTVIGYFCIFTMWEYIQLLKEVSRDKAKINF